MFSDLRILTTFQAIKSGLDSAGFTPEVQELTYFQDDYGLHEVEGEDEDEEEDEDDDDDDDEDDDDSDDSKDSVDGGGSTPYGRPK